MTGVCCTLEVWDSRLAEHGAEQWPPASIWSTVSTGSEEGIPAVGARSRASVDLSGRISNRLASSRVPESAIVGGSAVGGAGGPVRLPNSSVGFVTVGRTGRRPNARLGDQPADLLAMGGVVVSAVALRLAPISYALMVVSQYCFRRRVRRTGCHAPSSVGDGEASPPDRVLVTAAVLEIPASWGRQAGAHRCACHDDTGSMSVVSAMTGSVDRPDQNRGERSVTRVGFGQAPGRSSMLPARSDRCRSGGRFGASGQVAGRRQLVRSGLYLPCYNRWVRPLVSWQRTRLVGAGRRGYGARPVVCGGRPLDRRTCTPDCAKRRGVERRDCRSTAWAAAVEIMQASFSQDRRSGWQRWCDR